MSLRVLPSTIAVVTFLAAAPHATGQTTTPAPEVAPDLPAPEETIPEQVFPCNPGSYEPPEDTSEDRAEALADCEEVIPAPPTGDEEMGLTPPDVGAATPVIPPEDVPEQ